MNFDDDVLINNLSKIVGPFLTWLSYGWDSDQLYSGRRENWSEYT